MVYVFAIVAGLIGALGGGAIGFLAAAATGVSSDGFVPFVVTVPMAAMGFIAAAALTIMFKGDVRSPREIAIRTAAVVLMTAVIAVGGFNLRTIAFSHLGLLSKVPAAEFEIRLSSTTTPADRMVVLSLPEQAQRVFGPSLTANPSLIAEFGPWHPVELTETVERNNVTTQDDSVAIRYRVLEQMS